MTEQQTIESSWAYQTAYDAAEDIESEASSLTDALRDEDSGEARSRVSNIRNLLREVESELSEIPEPSQD